MTGEELQAIEDGLSVPAGPNWSLTLGCWAFEHGRALIAALREARADTEAVKHQMQVAGDLANQNEREHLAEITRLKAAWEHDKTLICLASEEIARLERLVSQRDEEAAEMREHYKFWADLEAMFKPPQLQQ